MTRGNIGRSVTALGCSLAATLAAGCDGGFSLVISPPEDCYRADVIETGCTTQETVYTYCDDPFGIFCYDEIVIEEICGDVVVDSYLVCE